MILAEKALLIAALGLAMAGPAFSDDSTALFSDSTDGQAPGSSSQAPVDATTKGKSAQAFTLTLSGSNEFDYHFPLYSGSYDYDGEMKSPTFTNDFGVEMVDGNIKLVSHWDLDIMPDGLSTGFQSGNGADCRYGIWGNGAQVKPLENYVSWSPSVFKFAFGYQIYSWGVADKVNPTDNLNPRDYTTGWNADKIPVLSADLNWYASDHISLEAVFVPYEQMDIYPVNFIGEITGSNLSQLGATGSNVGYSSPAYDPSSSVAGGKLSYRSSVLDFSLSYLYDLDPYYTPKITTQLTPNGYAIGSISLDRRRINRFGADAKTTLGKLGLWFEGCYSLTDTSGSDDYAVRESRLDYTLGFDVSYGPGETYYMNIQYIGSYIPGFDTGYGSSYPSALAVLSNLGNQAYMQEYYERTLVNALGLETEGLLQGLTLDLKWEFLDGLVTPQVTAVYTLPFLYDTTQETRFGNLGLNPEIDVKPVDSFHIKLGADLAYAWYKAGGGGSIQLDTSTDRLGIYTPYNNLYLTVLYKWNCDPTK